MILKIMILKIIQPKVLLIIYYYNLITLKKGSFFKISSGVKYSSFTRILPRSETIFPDLYLSGTTLLTNSRTF